jgi:hypothetical protein
MTVSDINGKMTRYRSSPKEGAASADGMHDISMAAAIMISASCKNFLLCISEKDLLQIYKMAGLNDNRRSLQPISPLVQLCVLPPDISTACVF